MTDCDFATLYNSVYHRHQEGSFRSAQILLGHLFELYRPRSVVDFGCGPGMWLAAAESLGCTELKGYDGAWVDAASLASKAIDLSVVNLEDRIVTDRRYDLAISVEVAEHLSERRAESFVDDLCQASDIILFGAAIPYQGGCHHINERCQSYWVGLFRQHGYVCHDVIRPIVWENDEVECWYRQNTFLMVHGGISRDRLDLTKLKEAKPDWAHNVVHPNAFKNLAKALARKEEQLAHPGARLILSLMRKYLLRKVGFRCHKETGA